MNHRPDKPACSHTKIASARDAGESSRASGGFTSAVNSCILSAEAEQATYLEVFAEYTVSCEYSSSVGNLQLLVNRRTYCFEVRAYISNSDTNSTDTVMRESILATPRAQPAVPRNLSVAPGDGFGSQHHLERRTALLTWGRQGL